MKKKATEMVCILDRSGSMYKKRKDTIGSFNQMLEKQKREPGEAYITTALFSDQCDVLYSHTPIRETEELTEQDYYNRRKHSAVRRHRKSVSPDRQSPGRERRRL